MKLLCKLKTSQEWQLYIFKQIFLENETINIQWFKNNSFRQVSMQLKYTALVQAPPKSMNFSK